MFKAFKTILNTVASVPNATVEAIMISKAMIENEVDSFNESRKMSIAVEAIKEKAEAIKELMEILNISAEEAEALLEKQLNKGKNNE